MFAPAPAYQPAMNYGQMQAAAAYGPAVAVDVQPMETAYVQPVETAYATGTDSDGAGLLYATGGLLLVGAVAARAARGDQKRVSEPDLEAAKGAVQVAMLFSSGRSSGKPKGKAAGRGKPAAKGGRKAPNRKSQPAVDDEDLFFHEGTKGFQGDELAFVYRSGLA
jgi:hypothetical protein